MATTEKHSLTYMMLLIHWQKIIWILLSLTLPQEEMCGIGPIQ
jgi:hypothetical protein